MQAVILAAGSSTRTYPLTLTKPKPLLKAANKTLLEHNLDALEGTSKEVIIVVGYKKDMIKDFLKNKYKNFKITFIEQPEQIGTGHALLQAEKFIKGRFILLMGDNIYSKLDIKNISSYPYSILTKKEKNPGLFGVVVQNNSILADIVEKPKSFVSDIISCALYAFDKKIFFLLKKVRKSKRGEYEITDAIKQLSMEEEIHCIESKQWLPIGYPWDLLEADKILRNGKNLVGKNIKIDGKIENSSVGNNCIIKGKIKNSIVMDDSVIDDGIVEDSIIGENVYFKGIAESGKNVKSIVNGKPVLAARLGAIIADNVKAENVNIKPGCKIWPNKNIKGKIDKDIA